MFSIYNARYFDKVALLTPGYREITDRIVQLVGREQYCAVLDLGSGTGRMAITLSGNNSKIVAVDNSEEMLKKLSERIKKKHVNNIQITKKDITSWEFLWPNTDPILTEYAFTSIVCSFILHHFKYKWKKIVIDKLREALRPEGQIIIADVKPEKVWQIRKQTNAIYWKLIREKENRYPIGLMAKNILSCLFFEHSLSVGSWEKVLREAGYKNIKNEAFGEFILIWANN
jgi:ubiquinone/menaquinone biosynthesis C-methylase UbiE